MNKYEILGRMKAKHVSFARIARETGEAPQTVSRHFDQENLTQEEMRAMIKLLDIEPLDRNPIFFN